MNMKRALILSAMGAFLLPGLAMAQTATRAEFTVTKISPDGNPNGVEFTIDCNTGLILDQDKVVVPGQNPPVTFVVTDFTAGSMNCTIEEAGVSGYSGDYAAGGSGATIDDATECVFAAVQDGAALTCEVTNIPDEVTIVVDKDWVIEGANNNVNLDYYLYAYCENQFEPLDVALNHGIGSASGEGPASDTFEFTVRPGYPSSSCWVEEQTYDSAIESDNGCQNLTVSAGQGTSCTITNSVFFEGIPTLSQYGMAIMALLMLGVGFVGFRRFV
ncbi:MAG TPA: IPTL-CTERM sorting domain-containing protein [Xanthomonadales bacterium]|nr:IPTL-CTERM sorting domain-containing protein [Xanthomonadales bacterium]